MTSKSLLCTCIAAAAMLGCAREPQEPAAETAAPPSAAAAPAGPVRPDTRTAKVVLLQGQSMSGELSRPKAGQVTGWGVKIGNYKNRSDGSLKMEICQQERCASATSALQGSRDNQLLEFVPATPLDIVAGTPVTWTLSRDQASNQVAVWLYDKAGDSRVALPDGSAVARAPRIVLHYAKGAGSAQAPAQD